MTIDKLFSRVLVRQRDYGKGRICSRDDQCPHQSYCNNLEGTCKCKSDLIGDGRTCKLGKFYKLMGSMNTGARNQERAIPILLGRLCPEVHPLPFRYHFWQKRNPWCLLLTNGTPLTNQFRTCTHSYVYRSCGKQVTKMKRAETIYAFEYVLINGNSNVQSRRSNLTREINSRISLL